MTEQEGVPEGVKDEGAPPADQSEKGILEIASALSAAQRAQDFNTAPTKDALPEWAEMPAGLNPPKGAPLGFLMFKPEWTRCPEKGARTCIVWSLTDMDERLAFARVRDHLATAANEMAKQMIRAVDGVKVDWSAKEGAPGNLDDFWKEIGPKCRAMVVRYYNRTHMMSPEETADFLSNCVAVRTAG